MSYPIPSLCCCSPTGTQRCQIMALVAHAGYLPSDCHPLTYTAARTGSAWMDSGADWEYDWETAWPVDEDFSCAFKRAHAVTRTLVWEVMPPWGGEVGESSIPLDFTATRSGYDYTASGWRIDGSATGSFGYVGDLLNSSFCVQDFSSSATYSAGVLTVELVVRCYADPGPPLSNQIGTLTMTLEFSDFYGLADVLDLANDLYSAKIDNRMDMISEEWWYGPDLSYVLRDFDATFTGYTRPSAYAPGGSHHLGALPSDAALACSYTFLLIAGCRYQGWDCGGGLNTRLREVAVCVSDTPDSGWDTWVAATEAACVDVAPCEVSVDLLPDVAIENLNVGQSAYPDAEC